MNVTWPLMLVYDAPAMTLLPFELVDTHTATPSIGVEPFGAVTVTVYDIDPAPYALETLETGTSTRDKMVAIDVLSGAVYPLAERRLLIAASRLSSRAARVGVYSDADARVEMFTSALDKIVLMSADSDVGIFAVDAEMLLMDASR